MTQPALATEHENLIIHEFSSRNQCARQLADDVAAWLEHAIEERGKASLVVSGGSTPIPFFEALRKKELDWDKVWITLADERWVSPDHHESTELLVREHLLHGASHFVPLKNACSTPEEGQYKAEQAIRSMPRPFDVTILGMGPDGHTASLFPNHPALAKARDEDWLVMPVENSPKPPPSRMTLTIPALLASRRIVLHVTGAEKKDMLETALAQGPEEELPIRSFLHQEEVPVSVYWAG